MALINFTEATNGNTANASDINTPLNTIYDEFNGNISSVNLASDAVTTAKLADDSVTPAKRSGGFDIGTIDASDLGSTGNHAVTGLGFQPKLVRLTVQAGAGTGTALVGTGSMTSTDQYYVASATNGSNANRIGDTSHCIGWVTGTSATTTPSLLCSYVSMDSDGFTINVDTASSSFDVAYEAYA